MYILTFMIALNNGFTLIEVLAALFIMSIGFLALSQMQYLSLKQTQLAHSGTTAANLIQAYSDSDLSRIRIIHSLNQQLVIRLSRDENIDANDPILTYCNADPCGGECPCDPLKVINTDTENNNLTRTCSGIDIEAVNIKNPVYSTDIDTCKKAGVDYFVVRSVDLRVENNEIPPQRTFNIEYSIKNPTQFNRDGLNPGAALATNTIEISAHTDTSILENAPDGIEKLLVFPNIP